MSWFLNTDGTLGEINGDFLRDLDVLNKDVLSSSMALLTAAHHSKLSHPDHDLDFLHLRETLTLQEKATHCMENPL
jgi:hypothetical protein